MVSQNTEAKAWQEAYDNLFKEHQKLQAFAHEVAVQLTIQEMVGQETYDEKTPADYVGELDSHGEEFNRLILKARSLEAAV